MTFKIDPVKCCPPVLVSDHGGRMALIHQPSCAVSPGAVIYLEQIEASDPIPSPVVASEVVVVGEPKAKEYTPGFKPAYKTDEEVETLLDSLEMQTCDCEKGNRCFRVIPSGPTVKFPSSKCVPCQEGYCGMGRGVNGHGYRTRV